MRIYLFLFFLLTQVYFSPVFATENKQDVVAAASSSPVFMPLDKYRHHKAVNPRQEVYIPLKPRPLPRSSTKKMIEPEYGPPYFPAADTNKATTVPIWPKAARAPAKMTPDQAKQILSIYGTDH
jgi:hypothetical protein